MAFVCPAKACFYRPVRSKAGPVTGRMEGKKKKKEGRNAMMISTKGRYALRVMLDLADHNTGDYIPLKDIARRQEISVKYLETFLPP